MIILSELAVEHRRVFGRDGCRLIARHTDVLLDRIALGDGAIGVGAFE